jgi:hypothetical protein
MCCGFLGRVGPCDGGSLVNFRESCYMRPVAQSIVAAETHCTLYVLPTTHIFQSTKHSCFTSHYCSTFFFCCAFSRFQEVHLDVGGRVISTRCVGALSVTGDFTSHVFFVLRVDLRVHRSARIPWHHEVAQ